MLTFGWRKYYIEGTKRLCFNVNQLTEAKQNKIQYSYLNHSFLQECVCMVESSILRVKCGLMDVNISVLVTMLCLASTDVQTGSLYYVCY